jgi:hypothetical protein
MSEPGGRRDTTTHKWVGGSNAHARRAARNCGAVLHCGQCAAGVSRGVSGTSPAQRRLPRLGKMPRHALSSRPFSGTIPSTALFYRLWQDMNLGIAAVFGDFLKLPLARTFELYELWCFLRLVRAAAEEFGPAGLDVGDLFIRDAAGGVTLAAGAVTVAVGGDWKLCFQKQYREFWTESDRRGSYSRIMTPDVAVVHSPAGVNPAALLFLTRSTGSRKG